MIHTLKEIVVMDNGFVKVHNDRVEFSDKSRGNYFKLSISDGLPNYGVAGVVITDDNKLVLMDNFRYAHQAYNTETVKGFGMTGKTPKEAFEIEMLEEVGCVSDDITETLTIREGSHTYWIHCFVAKQARFTESSAQDVTEDIKNIRTVTFDQAREMIASGEMTDTMTLALVQNALLMISQG